jgi:hypothetical protein
MTWPAPAHPHHRRNRPSCPPSPPRALPGRMPHRRADTPRPQVPRDDRRACRGTARPICARRATSAPIAPANSHRTRGGHDARSGNVHGVPGIPGHRRSHKMRASRRGGNAVHHEIHRRAAGQRQDQVPTWPLVQRAHRVPHHPGGAGHGRCISQPAAPPTNDGRSATVACPQRARKAMTPLAGPACAARAVPAARAVSLRRTLHNPIPPAPDPTALAGNQTPPPG